MAPEPTSAPAPAWHAPGHHSLVLPRRDPDALTTPLGAEVLLRHRVSSQAHVLSPSAAEVWSACDGTTTVSDLAARLAADHAADPALVAGDLADALARFTALGLVLGPEGASLAVEGPAVPTLAVPTGPDLPDPADLRLPAATTTFSLAGTLVQFRSDHPDLIRYLDAVLAPLATDTTRAGAPGVLDVAVAVRSGDAPGGGGTLAGAVWVDGELVGRPHGPTGTAAFVLWHCNRMAISSGRPRLSVHAGAVVSADGAIALVPAPPDSGKSTLTLGLVRSGFRYLGDEAFGLALDDGAVVPYLKPLTLDPGSWPLFDDLEPDLGDLAGFAHGKWYVDVREVGGGVPDDPGGFVLADVTTVVLPTYEAGAATSLEPLAAGDLALALAGNVFNLAECGQAGLDVLATLTMGASGWRLVNGDLGEAMAAVRRCLALS